MDPSSVIALIVLALVVIFVLTAIGRTVRIVPQATAVIVERLGRYHSTLDAGLHFLIPFVDRARANVDLREQVVSFPPQPVITSDNLVVSIDTVIYFQPTDPKAATYEIANYIQGIEQLTVTTLRNVIGSLDLEQTLTSRDQINGQLRGVLDEATGRWGIRVNRVELKAIDPPHSVQDSMEQQMRAERNRRAAILNAEGVKQSQILTAEGDKQSSVLRAEGQAQAAILEAQGQAQAIQEVFEAIHAGNPDSKLLAYQYLQMLPQIAQGPSSKMWIVPSELTQALKGIAGAMGGMDDDEPIIEPTPRSTRERPAGRVGAISTPRLQDPRQALDDARSEVGNAESEASRATGPSPRRTGRTASPDELGQAPHREQLGQAPHRDQAGEGLERDLTAPSPDPHPMGRPAEND